MAISIIQNPVPLVLVDSKGDMFVATGDDTVAKLSVGANDTILTADSAQTGGVKWSAPVVTNTSSNSFSNKTIALSSNTVSGTTSEFNTANTDANFVTDTTFTAKGTVLVGTGNGTFAVVSVGANGTTLTADSVESSGVKWAPAASGGFNSFLLMG